MQRLKIVHNTTYQFSQPVQLGLHYLLLRPRESHELKIERSKLDISPDASLLWRRDVQENCVAVASFEGESDQLVIESEVIIQQYNENPLDFIVADYAVDYPFNYVLEDQMVLSPYLLFPDNKNRIVVTEWIAKQWQPSEPIQTYVLLERLCSHIHESLEYKLREEPGVQTPVETLSMGTGSCRDFATLLMEAARCLGLAARFISGYLYVPGAPDFSCATHAWTEVYLPGAGWVGFDPTIGKLAGPDHIAVAVAKSPESIPPIAGAFTGAATSTLTVGVTVDKLDD